ncbi:hypothetical protein CALVIDRAFT_345217 [Calocera viscosa TUFC12733]|uniref:Uncharacterized protein n=1 Tax=Calocera viscosa (strain TUFC12733) TaxID=1330018 RepID=A0A167HAH7_CALVF|nr:hypothetical protein CALVIDRAFT_345217 [Calocera viscosa TUFC12733]
MSDHVRWSATQTVTRIHGARKRHESSWRVMATLLKTFRDKGKEYERKGYFFGAALNGIVILKGENSRK